MPIFILLSTLTQQGVQTIKSNPERLRQVNADVEEFGCKVLHQWATLGEFDFVNIVEAPDIATVAKVSIALSDLVLSPLLFLGGAMLYVDQAARVGSHRSTRRRSRDADLHPPVDPDATGRSDPQVEP